MTGFRTWSTGDSVSAADFVSYISTQSVLIFADASARSSAVASPVDGMVSSLTTDNVISIYNGSAWVDVIDIDTLTVSGGNYTMSGSLTLTGGTPIVLEGATADAYETSIAVTDPTADRTITLPNVTGTVITTGNPPTALGTLTGGSPIVLEGATANAYETTIAVTDPTADRTITLPDATGTVALGTLLSWSGSTANGLATYGSSSSIVSESTATYDGTTLQLTTSGGGLKMDGLDSSDVNTLDDYEEGEFTISATCASGTITINASNNTCAYTKVGRLVTVQGETSVSAISSPSGQITIAGFPFTCTNSGTETAGRSWDMGTVVNTATDVDGTPAFAIFANSATTLCFTVGNASIDYFGNRIDTGTYFQVYGSYITDA